MSGLQRFGIAVISLSFLIIIALACKKKVDEPTAGGGPADTDTTVVVPVSDPPISKTTGFFLDDWQPKNFVTPAYIDVSPITSATANTITIDASSVITKIPLSIFGHNANTWMTPMVTEPKFMTAITDLHPHIIRFPAGSGSDVYFWNRETGSLPPDAPAQIMDMNGVVKDPGYWFGKINANWSASLDNYYSMLQQSGNRGMITVNYGYARYGTSDNPVAAAAHLAADWVRYDNGRTAYWEIGNESYGDWEWGYRIDVSKNKDGQAEYLTGKLYGEHFQVFADSMKAAAAEKGTTIYIGATLYDSPTESWQTNTVKTWNASLLLALKNKADFFIVHSYFTPYNENSTAGVVINSALTVPSKMMNHVNSALITSGSDIKPLALTEWNMWAKDSKQQVSNISGIFAIIVTGEALKNKYGMAARWDLLNGWENGNDHGLFSAGDEPGIPKWTPRPSFYYLYFFQKLLGDRIVPTTVKGSSKIIAYASTYTTGEANVTMINSSSEDLTVSIETKNFNPSNRYYYYELKGSNDNGEFSRKVFVNGSGPSLDAGGPENYTLVKARSALSSKGIKVTVPALGAVCMVID